METHKELQVWQGGIDLVETVYKVTSVFPASELCCLTSQMRRSALSVPSNIAEGAARHTSKEFIQFLYIALGSLSELETQFIIAQRLNYIDDNSVMESIEALRRKLLNFIKYRKDQINR